MDDPVITSATSASAVDAGAVFILAITLCAFIAPMLVLFPPVPPRRGDALRETHARLGIDPLRSHLRDQHSESAHPRESGAAARVKSLFVYPVKSCKGIEVERTKVFPQGLEFDRLFTLAQLKRSSPATSATATPHADGGESPPRIVWDFITQRQFPLLATVEVELWLPDLEKQKGKAARVSEAFILLRFPWRDPGLMGSLSWITAKLSRGCKGQPDKEICLPVDFPSEEEIREKGYEYGNVRIWKDTVSALDMGSELPEELRLYLGVSNKMTLFRVDPAQLREVYRCAPSKDEAGYQPVTGFQDAYPLHLLGLSSVQDLESKLARDDDLQNLDARRFRPNIIVSGSPPYDEDSWRQIRFKPEPGQNELGESTFHVSCRTVRCKLPNVDQDTGTRHRVEPDKSLRAYRDVDEGAPKMGCLGMQLTPLFEKTGRLENMESRLAVGMTIDVLERGSHRYIRQ